MIGTFSMKESNVTFKVNKQHHWRCTSIFIVRVEHISHFFLVFSCRIWTGKAVNYFRKNLYPCKYFTWFPRRFNVESTWCVCWDLRCLTEFPLRLCIQWDVIHLCIQLDVIRLCVKWDVMRVFTIDWTTFRTFLLITSSLGSTATLLLGSKS